MSEEGWEGALDTLGGDPGATAVETPPSGGVPAGLGAPTETDIPAGTVPAGVQKPEPDVKPAPSGRVGDAKPKPQFMRSDEIPDDDAKVDPPKVEPPKPDAGRKKDGIAALRESYELTKAEKAKLEARVAEIEKTREEGTKAEVAKATEALRKEVEDIRKAREQAESELRFANYTRSAEYREKYRQPIEDAYKVALEDIKGVQVMDDGAAEARDASSQELLAVLQAPSAAKAAQIANEIFGSAAPLVMQHRSEILKLERARQSAIDEWKAKGAEREKEREARTAQTQQEIRRRWEQSLETTISERPSLYARPKDDDALGKAWDDGDKLVRLAFLGEVPPEVGDVSDRDGLAIEAQAEIAARVRGFNVMAHRNVALKAEVARLKAQLQKVTGSEPGQQSAPREAAKTETWEDKLMAL